jgi:transcriptional regulator with XRE-family HTH domain
MICDMIAKVRTEKGMTKTELARLTNINIGHLTHIEKGERNPSHKALKNICKALDIPYQQLMYTYDKQLSEDQEAYGFINHISYNKVPLIDYTL